MTNQGAVVITGASTGIGRATALFLDRNGFQVVAGVRRDADAESLRKEASENLHPIQLDVVDGRSIEASRKTVVEALGEGGLAGLVNNAGISVGGPFEFLDLDELRRQMEVNFVGPVAVTQTFLPLLRKARGRVVNVSSIGGRMAAPIIGAYAASKFAIEAFSDSLRLELSPWGMHVSVIEPGAIATPMFEKGQTNAERSIAQASQQEIELYGSAIDAVRTVFGNMEKSAVPPERVAKAIHRALTAKRPRTRYVVGPDAKVQSLLASVLPDRVRDGLVKRLFKYPRSA